MRTLTPPEKASSRGRLLLSWALVPALVVSAAGLAWLFDSRGLETQRDAVYLTAAILWPFVVTAATFLHYPRDRDVALHRAGELLIGLALFLPVFTTLLFWWGNTFGGAAVGVSLAVGFVLGIAFVFATSHLIEDTYPGGWAP